MPPPKGTPNVLEGPGDYEATSVTHNDTYLLAKDVEAAAVSAARSAFKMLLLKLDVTNEQSVEKAAAEVEEEFGKLDVLVNNAGILGQFGMIADSKPEKWWQVLDVNVRGAYLVTRAFIPLLLKGTDDKFIINVASVGAHLVNPALSAYEVSKVALLRLTQLVNAEYSPQGVVSRCIHPGNCLTDTMGPPEELSDHLKPIIIETPELSADSIISHIGKARLAWR
ncbi:hypothetical protein JMJ35_001324 [Cladonia borealis]|uniref:Uncharacterized protein n=1 Tax=Cladonia borealis TaxID=184061 RepID=A0AA39R9Q3_9LECA|nr:hypothetical protein JMJ35_001324 [Cladonia borealis]